MEPTLKIKITMTFRDLDICNPKTIGMGRTITMMSVMMLSMPVAIYKAVLFRHCPSLTVTSVFLANGLQAASRDTTMPTQDPITTNMVK